MAADVPSTSNGLFTTTHWSVVLATRETGTARGSLALEALCRAYWYPLYAYVRRRGYTKHDAQDLTQGFFAQLLDRGSIQKAEEKKGRFRSFLLASLNYFMADQRDRAGASKRGGGHEVFSLDVEEAENRYRFEPADERNPEKIFEHRWAMTLLDQVLGRLEQEFQRADKNESFKRLQPFLVEGAREQSYAKTALENGMSEEAFKKAVQRFRRRYYQLFREEIAHTVAVPEEVDDELRHLCSVLGSC